MMGEGLIAGQYLDIQEEAVDAQLTLERQKAYSSPGQGDGLIDGQRPAAARVERAIDTERMWFLESNLYLPGNADTTSEIQRLQQLYWELEAPRTPASSTAPYNYGDEPAGSGQGPHNGDGDGLMLTGTGEGRQRCRDGAHQKAASRGWLPPRLAAFWRKLPPVST